jgi:cell division protein FtsN
VTITETPPVVPFTGNNVIYINGENAENAVKIERTSDGGTKTYITIPSPQTGANSQGTGTPAAVAAAPMAPAGEPKTTAAAPKAPPAKAAPKVTRNDYWIQVGSYSLKSRADDAKSYLAEKKGLGSIIVDSNLNGKVVYRVRVGPYTSQSEAKYWLSLIKEIEGMNDSIVWKSTVTM